MTDHVRILPVTLMDLQQLAGENRLYAVMDSCDSPAIHAKIESLDTTRALCLFRGEISPEVLAVAPYLVQVDEALLTWIGEKVWRVPWGIFVIAELDSNSVRRHLRRFLVVQDTDGEAMYFRYYDPRVLPVFILSCNRTELTDFFGKFSAFGFVDENKGDVFLVHRKA